MLEIIYFLVAILATTIGATAGLGGGVVIKPVLDSMNTFSLPTVNLLSSATIFVMAVVSIIKQLLKRDKINKKSISLIAIGSVIGGIIGQKILRLLVKHSSNINNVNILQSVMLIVILLFSFFYMEYRDKFKKHSLNSIFLIILMGIFLGSISAFLGIGGGPINVAVLTIFFGMNAKDATRNSIIIIMFSQGAKILSVACTTGFGIYNLKALPVMLIGGVIGGLLGYKLNKKLSEKSIVRIFNVAVILITLLNVYNIVKLL